MSHKRFLSSSRTTAIENLIESTRIPCEVEYPSGKVKQFGVDKPKFIVTLRTNKFLSGGVDEFTLGQAYVNGEFDISGDMYSLFDLREYLKHEVRLSFAVRLCSNLFLRSCIAVNMKSIAAHYTLGDDFYLCFVDKAYRFYSHCVFHSDDETLEQAAEHKLESMFEALELKPGRSLLDIGSGWGGVTEYCGQRGVNVTSITLTDDSYNYTNELIRRFRLTNCKCHKEDFLNHRPAAPYDAIVIYGVIEHMPYYGHFVRQVWDCLKPGGRLYVDASATKEKFDMSNFTRHYIWHGTHTFLCLQDLIHELLLNGMSIVQVRNESHDYALTMFHWASRLDQNREMIIERWGDKIYRAFRLYLWAGSHCFCNDTLQAYQVVARRCETPGPRPNILKRSLNFVRGLR